MSAPPDQDRIVAKLVRFGRALRDAGLEIGPSRTRDAVEALAAVPIGSRDQAYWALRCSLISRREDIEIFDQVFAAFFDGALVAHHELAPATPAPAGDERAKATASDGEPAPANADEPAGSESRAGTHWSAVERLRDRDFARYTPAELRQAARLVERIAAAAPLRRSRRLRAAPDGPMLDGRRTLRAAMHTEGYPLTCTWRRPRLAARKLTFVVDVSGSMEPYARAMVMFLQAAVRSGRRVEAFTFGTRLTRVTRELEGRDPDRALHAAARVVQDWAGGTRIGANLAALRERFGPLGVTRGAVVVIVSDGWERGDVPALAREMERLRRTAHTIVWVNPLAGDPGYAPLAQGMAAALPYVDHFLPGHNLRALEALADVLESLPSARQRPAAAQPGR